MAAAADRADAHALVDDLLGPSDAAADRAVVVLHAHAAALAWVRDTTGTYPAPASVADRLAAVAEQLRKDDDRDPVAVLGQAAVDALAALAPTPPREQLHGAIDGGPALDILTIDTGRYAKA